MLRVIVFVCGAAIMGLELVAARVLAPAMGNSIYVWGAVISSVMVALSLGYWVGGHAADRWGPSRLLPPVIAGAALATMFAPALVSVTLPWAAELGPRLGSLVATALVFFVPSLLLATVSPLGVRLASADIEHVGRSAGGLYAVSLMLTNQSRRVAQEESTGRMIPARVTVRRINSGEAIFHFYIGLHAFN